MTTTNDPANNSPPVTDNSTLNPVESTGIQDAPEGSGLGVTTDAQ